MLKLAEAKPESPPSPPGLVDGGSTGSSAKTIALITWGVNACMLCSNLRVKLLPMATNDTNRSTQTGRRPANETRREGPFTTRREAHTQRQSSENTLLTRRNFLYGAAGVGAVAAIGAGAYAINASRHTEEATADIAGGDGDINAIEVPESALTTLNDFEVIENAEDRVTLVGTYDLDYGTLIWVDDDDLAACLLPTESGSPLSKIGLLHLGSGNLATVRSKAVGSKDRFEIYDVRATSEGIIWTEANVLGGVWRIYAAKLSGDSAGEAQLLEEGDTAYDTPTLAVSGKYAFWQVIPKTPNTEGLTSRLMRATFGNDDVTCVFEAARRMGTPPYSANGSIVIAPRIDSPSVYYQLTNIDAETGEVTDRLTMPQSMVPLEAGYGSTGFMFSIPDIYNNGTALSNLGTYTPRSMPNGGNYAGASWFGFARTPSAAPAWCGDLLIVKSSYSVCGVDLAAGNYFAIDVENGADTYGDYLATSGTHPTFVTYSNVDHNPVNAKAIHACRVKVWQPHALTISAKEDSDETEDAETLGTETVQA